MFVKFPGCVFIAPELSKSYNTFKIISIMTYMHQQHLKCFLSDTDHWLKTKQITHRRTNMLFWMPVLPCFRWNDKTFFMCANRNHTWRRPPSQHLSLQRVKSVIFFWHPYQLSNRSVTLEVCLTSFIGFFTQRDIYKPVVYVVSLVRAFFRTEAIKM